MNGSLKEGHGRLLYEEQFMSMFGDFSNWRKAIL